MSERYDFDMELYFALHDGLGPKSDRAYGARVLGQLAQVIYSQLGREDTLRFFRCTMAATRMASGPQTRRRPRDHLSDVLSQEFGVEVNERLDAAWSIFQAAQNIAGKEQAERVSRCVVAALEPELAVIG
ncbi:hypothetical protein [Streptomyces scopuliridis]|uniref:hypothetical protein n=1 Tax=Streptomyces scopuliridis TaxID=452529 RepID=UPI0036D14907